MTRRIITVAAGALFALLANAAEAQQAKETDLQEAMIRLESASNVFVIDGLNAPMNTSTIDVPVGAVVEVQFAQLYNGKDTWWFANIKPGPAGFFGLNDFKLPPLVNGQFQLKQPGAFTFRFKADQPGKYVLAFKHGLRSSPFEDQPKQLEDQSVSITIEVKP